MYNIKSVSKMLEMPAVTIRAWERRYLVVVPTRSDSGHRLYSEQDIEDLRWLKIQTEEKGVNISQAVKMLEKIREQRKLLPETMTQGMARGHENFDSVRERLYAALTNFDQERSNQLMSLAFSMFHFEEVFHQVLAPLLYQIGDDWERGVVTVAQEHFASHFITQRFFQFFHVFSINPSLPKVLAFCPSGEQHQIGLLLFTLFLRRQGVEVIYLGTDTPLQGVENLIERHRVDWVCVSITDPRFLSEMETIVERLQVKFPHVKLVLGGQGFQDVREEWRPLMLGGSLEQWNVWFQEEVGR